MQIRESHLYFAPIMTCTKEYPKTANIEKLFTQPKELFEAVDFAKMGIINESTNFIPKFVEGEKYSLKGIACDGFEMKEKVYELVGIVNEFHGTPIDSLIVKQISGDKGQIFTLSKNDCSYLGIEYESGLQLFPKSLHWEKVKDVIPFDKNNLATTPLSDIDNTIRYIVLKLNGFKDFSDGYVLTPSGHLITEKQFESTIRVQALEPIVYGNGFVTNDKTNLDIEIVYPKGLVYNHANFISSEDTIYLMVKLVKDDYESNTFDGNFGVAPKYFEGINPNKFFSISWDELGAYTVEEYEAEKERKAKEEAKRIKEEEAALLKKIEEEEKRIKEQKRLRENTINKMRGYDIKMPKMPKLPKIKNIDSITSIDLAINSFDCFFDELENSLQIINEDLTTLSKISGVIKSNSLLDIRHLIT